ncbi:hypothetical protein BKA82DRAFT_4419127, partial [Pisolithus tinctorius]
MPVCPTCQETIPSKKDYSTHTKKCFQENTIHLADTNQTIHLKREENGNFICHCSHRRCPRPFKYANSLRVHIQRAGTRWMGPGIKDNSPMQQKLDFPHGPGVEAGSSKGRASIDLTHGQGPESQPSKAKRSLEHAKDNVFVPGAGPSMSRAIMDLEDHDSIGDYTDEVSGVLNCKSAAHTHIGITYQNDALVGDEHLWKLLWDIPPPFQRPMGCPMVALEATVGCPTPPSRALEATVGHPTPLPELWKLLWDVPPPLPEANGMSHGSFGSYCGMSHPPLPEVNGMSHGSFGSYCGTSHPPFHRPMGCPMVALEATVGHPIPPFIGQWDAP